MNSFIRSILAFILCTCFFSAKDVDEAHRIMNTFTKYVKKEYDLKLIGSGGAMMDDIEVVFLAYASHRKLDVDSARILYVDLMEELLKRINSDKKIRPYLHDYPFSENNIELKISFYDLSNKRYEDGAIAYVSLIKGTIDYCIYDSKKVLSNPLSTIHEETYKEALRIVKSGKEGSIGISSQSQNDNLSMQ